MRRKTIEKNSYKVIIFIIIAVVYFSMLIFSGYKYLSSNRYWEIEGYPEQVIATSGQDLYINVKVKNKMYSVLGTKEQHYLSYHIYSENGMILQFENPRTAINDIQPGKVDEIQIKVKSPEQKGKYIIEIDIVKEGVYWFKDRGESPGTIKLSII